jgi:hypothetical protein
VTKKKKKFDDTIGARKHERDEFHIKTITPIGTFGIRKKGDEEMPGVLSNGEQIEGERVAVTPRADDPRVLDLRPTYATAKGPAQVATTEYRQGYDRIFGKTKTKTYVN